MVWEDYLWELQEVSQPLPLGSGIFRPSRLDDAAKALNAAAGVRFVDAHRARRFFGGDFPVAHVRPFTDAQIAKWHELADWRFADAARSTALYGKPEGLWVRMDELTAKVRSEIASGRAGGV